MPIFGAVGDAFKALADPTRRTILDELSERDGQTLFEPCARLTTKHGLGSSRQAISQHLGVLEDAGLVRTRKEHAAARPFKEALAADGIPFTSFAVEDVRAERERLTRAGARFTQDPAEMGPGMTTAVLDDTCGT